MDRIEEFLQKLQVLRTCNGEEDILVSSSGAYASDYLSPHLKCTDDLVRLHAYWARLELNLNKDLVAARGVWERLLKNSGSMFGAWQGYIAMELEAGHINEARSIYKRCYSKRFAGTVSEKDTAQNPKKVDGKGRIELENVVASNEEQELKARDDKPDDMNKRQMKGPSHERTSNYEHLRDFFSDVGGVTAIRILKDNKEQEDAAGKRLSIARSDPKQKGKGAGHSNDQTGTVGESDSKESGQISSSKAPQARRDDNFQLKGRNTFAVPRNVRPLGWIDKKKKTEEETDEMPKSNDEFRKMLLKSYYLSTKMWAHSSRKQKLTLLILSSAAGCVRQERSEICIFRILKFSTEGYGKVWNGLFGNGKGQDHNRRNSLYPTI
ncbi:hypothetical protein CK203_023865 [Vitis vinifera]|uniref:LSM-interacting domain-containing protein n=1 Tax=Vitis vinifera TaxID=29760 RepID=A0A438JAE3_VITVI|nr:hypothetical protein CK203_023865 [Vitis vinifera]